MVWSDARARKPQSLFSSSTDDVLDTLATQFRQRSAFVRELIQNSLDAGATHISIEIDADGETLHIRITDDGQGMDRSVIEEHLLVLFRSTKDSDHTQIGGFGVGFVSLFVLDPVAVIVDTARYGEHYRVVFDSTRHYTLLEVPEPFEGTCVELLLRIDDSEKAELAREIRDAVHHWCRYARAEITIDGHGPGYTFTDEKVDHAFTVEAPVTVVDESPGFRAVLGLTCRSDPLTAFYNGGLTLLEGREPAIPGVTFRVESGVLGHTLTRDNVRRDDNYHRVLRRLNNLAHGRLVQEYVSTLTKTVATLEEIGHPRLDELLALATHPLVTVPRDVPCFRTAAQTLVSLAQCRPHTRLRLRNPLPVVRAPRHCRLGARLTHAGIPALLAAPHPDADQAAALLGVDVVDAQTTYLAPKVVPDHPVAAAVCAAARVCGDTTNSTCVAAHFDGYGTVLADRLAIRQLDPGAIERVDQAELNRGALVLNLDHPTVQALTDAPAWIQGPMLLTLACRELGEAFVAPPRLADVILRYATKGDPRA